MAEDFLAQMKGTVGDAFVAVDESLASIEEALRPLAQQKMALLQQKIEKLDEIIKERDRLAEQLSALQSLYPDIEVQSNPHEESSQTSPAKEGRYKAMKMWEAARAVLMEEGRPMYTREIAEKVVAGGKKVSEPRSSKLNSTMRQRPDVFSPELKNNKAVWSLVEWEAKVNNKG